MFGSDAYLNLRKKKKKSTENVRSREAVNAVIYSVSRYLDLLIYDQLPTDEIEKRLYLQVFSKIEKEKKVACETKYVAVPVCKFTFSERRCDCFVHNLNLTVIVNSNSCCIRTVL
jgi:hypothetical protein